MLENEVKDFVNKVLRREHGKEIDFNDLLTASEIDSFGYAVLWMELEDKYKCFKITEKEIDYKTYKLRDVVEAVKASYAS